MRPNRRDRLDFYRNGWRVSAPVFLILCAVYAVLVSLYGWGVNREKVPRAYAVESGQFTPLPVYHDPRAAAVASTDDSTRRAAPAAGSTRQ